MITCEQAQNLFDAYLNDELSAAMTAELDAHRLDCASCRHQLTLMEACGNVVRLDTAEPRVSGDFTDRLMAILDEQPAERGVQQLSRKVKVLGGLLGIAATIAVIVTVTSPAPAPDESTRVAGQSINGRRTVASASLITGLPMDLFFEATDSMSSSIELGHFGINQFSASSGANGGPTLDPFPEFQIPSTQREPKLDVIDVQLPDLDDGGELM